MKPPGAGAQPSFPDAVRERANRGSVRGAVGLLVALFLLASCGTAQARNPHCSGGIQYWSLWWTDKEKNNLEDYKRELGKAIEQLQMCSAEDPKDFDALGYLAWCYAEADSAAAAGRTFARAIEGLNAKGDKKGVDRVLTNRDSYWTTYYNTGIRKLKDALDLQGTMTKETESSVKPQLDKNLREAIAGLDKALLLKPGDPNTLSALASAHDNLGDPAAAEALLREGLKNAPKDSTLQEAFRHIRLSGAIHQVGEKAYDPAIATLEEMAKSDSTSFDVVFNLASAYLNRGQTRQGDARKADLKSAGRWFAAASALKPDDCDVAYDAAIAYQNGGEWGSAEAYWRRALKCHPDDSSMLSDLAMVLVEEGKYAEAIETMHQGVMKSPKDKDLHHNLGSIYSKAGNKQKSTEELMVYLALDKGKPVPDAAAAAKAAKPGSTAAQTFSKMGPPDQLVVWETDNQKFESWFYWSKNNVFHFQGGELSVRSDWNTADLKPSGGTGGKK